MFVRLSQPFYPKVRPALGQPSAAKPFEEHSRTTSDSSSMPNATRCGATIVPAERTGTDEVLAEEDRLHRSAQLIYLCLTILAFGYIAAIAFGLYLFSFRPKF